MKRRYYAIKNNNIVAKIDVAPWSIEALNRVCETNGWDSWLELDDVGFLILGEFFK